MKMKYDPMHFEMPWRPNYEFYDIVGWLSFVFASYVVMLLSDMPNMPFVFIMGFGVFMAILRVPACMSLINLQSKLAGRELEIRPIDSVLKVSKTLRGQQNANFGIGFQWHATHTQRCSELMSRDWTTLSKEYKPDPVRDFIRQACRLEPIDTTIRQGQAWIHGVEPVEKDIYVPLKHLNGHLLILGTTGAGKTRLFDNMITQAIARGEPVFVIDPKGDKELPIIMRRACAFVGRPEAFYQFNSAFPDDSVRINPMANFINPTNLATRIASLIDAGNNASFRDFCWSAMNTIINALLLSNIKPTLRVIDQYVGDGVEGLVYQVIRAYGESILGDVEFEESFQPYMSQAQSKSKSGTLSPKGKAIASVQWFEEVIGHDEKHAIKEIHDIISQFRHDKVHFSKMVSSLQPIMSMLTSGTLGKMLSPIVSDLDDDRQILNMKQVISENLVLFVGLDTLTDATVGKAVGSLLLADLTAVCGEIYNYEKNIKPVQLFVDEAAEVLNEPFITLLNKARGAGFHLSIATQTISDLEAKLGSRSLAMMVVGNCNNTVVLRTIDPDTQEFVVKKLPKMMIKRRSLAQGGSVGAADTEMRSGMVGERLQEEEVDLVQPALLSMLPDLEFFMHSSGGRVHKCRVPIIKVA